MKNYLAVKMLLVAVLVPCAVLLRCANPNSGGTETGDSKIASMLYNPGGSPAVSAKVNFRHHDNDPRPGFDSGVVDSTTTDANGNYSVTLDPGTYTIEASGDSGLAYVDSVTVINDSTVRPDPDTLKPAGTIRGVVRLEEEGDPTTIFILFMGTRTFTWPDDTFGNFSSGAMAEGDYRVKILTTTPDYEVMDTSFTIQAGRDSLIPDTLVLRYTGIPVPKGLRIEYDTMKQIVTLYWNTPTSGVSLSGYNIYRKHQDSSIVLLKGDWTDTTYNDSTGIQDITYEYRVAAVDMGANEGVKSAGSIATITSAFAISDTIVKISGTLGSFDIDKEGNLYVANITSEKVHIYNTSGGLKAEWMVAGGFNWSDFRFANNIAVSSLKEIFLWNNNLHGVQRFDSSGLLLSQTPNIVSIGQGICISGDTVFVADFNPREIYAFNLNGDSLFSISHNWTTVNYLRSICSDSSGNIYAYGELSNSPYPDYRIECFDKNGIFNREISPMVAPYSLSAGTISSSNDQIILATFGTIYCFDLQGVLIYKFNLNLGFSYSVRKAVRAVDGSLIVGLKEGYFLRCSKR